VNAAIALSAGLLVMGLPAVSSAATTVNLGEAGYFSILTKAGISTTGATRIIGNMGVSPISGAAITGFSLVRKAPSYSTSPLVTGRIYAANYAAPTPVALTREIGDMQTAYVDAAGRTNPTATELGRGSINGVPA